jgi:IS1 family transposase/transposase-like protein
MSSEVVCPGCQGERIVKNGRKKTGKQILLCKDCRLQFQWEYSYQGADKKVKDKIVRMLLRGSGIRDCAAVMVVSIGCVLRLLLKEGFELEIKPRYHHYYKVQIDEQWSYIEKKGRTVYMLYAICAETSEILAACWGKRNRPMLRQLMDKLKGLDIDFYYTDNWICFAEVLPAEKHFIGKQYTKKIEEVNTWFRTRLRRLVRQTTCFSKKLTYHWSMMKLAIKKRNERASYI